MAIVPDLAAPTYPAFAERRDIRLGVASLMLSSNPLSI